MQRQYNPHLVSLASPFDARALTRRPLKEKSDYDERWIQQLIDQHPTVLPIKYIEPAFDPAISCCMELPLQSGLLDNLLVTPLGDLILVECKLWR